MTENTSLTTLARLRDANDATVWKRMFTRLSRAARSAAQKLPLSDEERDDVVSEAFLTFHRRFAAGKYDPTRGSLRTFMHCITESLGLNTMKNRARQHALVERLKAHVELNAAGEDAADRMDLHAARSDAYRRAIEAVLSRQRLRGRTREVLILSFREHMDPGEIARRMSWTPERVYRIRTRYRHLVESEARRQLAAHP